MEAEEALARALASTEAIVDAVEPAMLEGPTPCTQWHVRDLLNHLLGQLWAFQGRLAAIDPRYSAQPGGLPDEDLVGDDPSGAYKQVAHAVLVASREPGARERVGLAFGAYTTDAFVHGWDLAKATGQDVRFDDELARYCLDFLRAGLTEENRAPAFGWEVAVPRNASPIDELVAFSGRTPHPS